MICDATFLHGLKQLEIYPGEAKSKKPPKKKSKNSTKDELTMDPETRDLETAQTVIKDFNIRDLQNLAERLAPLNDMVCCNCDVFVAFGSRMETSRPDSKSFCSPDF